MDEEPGVDSSESDAALWMKQKLGLLPRTSLGWFRAGVGFFNKKQYAFSIQCLQRSVQLDPKNYNAFQIMARACIAVNRRDEAIHALKESVNLDNPSDWQLLVELTGQQHQQQQQQQAQKQQQQQQQPLDSSKSSSVK